MSRRDDGNASGVRVVDAIPASHVDRVISSSKRPPWACDETVDLFPRLNRHQSWLSINQRLRHIGNNASPLSSDGRHGKRSKLVLFSPIKACNGLTGIAKCGADSTYSPSGSTRASLHYTVMVIGTVNTTSASARQRPILLHA